MYRIFSIKRRSPIKRWPRKNTGCKLPILNENDPFGDLEPDIYEEEVNEIAVYED